MAHEIAIADGRAGIVIGFCPNKSKSISVILRFADGHARAVPLKEVEFPKLGGELCEALEKIERKARRAKKGKAS